jgi:hypothetical protein
MRSWSDILEDQLDPIGKAHVILHIDRSSLSFEYRWHALDVSTPE